MGPAGERGGSGWPGALRALGRWSGLLISGALLALILRRSQHLDQAWRALAGADYRWVGLAVVLYLVTFLPRGLRWQRLLAGVRPVALVDLTEVLFIGFMANNVLPLRLGELVRAYALGRKARVPAAAAFATIVVERVCDGLTLVAILTVILLRYPFPPWVKRLGAVTAALFVGVGAFIVLIAARRDLARRLVVAVARPLPPRVGTRVGGLFDQFDRGLHLLRSPLDAIAVFALSCLIWALECAVYTRVLAAFAGSIRASLDRPLALHEVLLLLVVLNFGIMIPSGPAYIGPFQAAVMAVLSGVAALAEPVAFSVSWVLWATLVLPTVLLGFVFVAREQLSLAAPGSWRRVDVAE